MNNIGIIGGGNMGEAIISSVLKRFFVFVSEKNVERQQYLQMRYKLIPLNIKRLAQTSDMIILAVKPQDMDDVLKELSGEIKKDTLVISIAAGITTQFIERHLGKGVRVVRTMPNMPALINQGITAIAKGKFATDNDIVLVSKVFSSLGKTVTVDEESIDAVTAVSGSGPAYVFLFIECMIAAAETIGLKKALAEELVQSTFAGSVNLLLKQKIDAATLRAKVTSKGGTTQAALKVFHRKDLEGIITLALKAAKRRSKELSKK